MSRVFRILVALCLALAVPLQGLAGVTMAACGTVHAHSAMASAAATHGDSAMAHDHAAMGHDHAAMGHEGAGAAPASHEGEKNAADHRCTACAACCNLSAAPVPAVAFQGAVPAPNLAIPFLEAARASVAPDGLERPPRPPHLG